MNGPVERRAPLTRQRVLRAAVALADAGGLESLTMRRLGEELSVGPMALYRHVANKDDLVDGLIDIVFGEIGLPSADAGWGSAMRERAISMRDVLGRHPWAIALMESRRHPGPANLQHHDAVIGSLLGGGFDMAGAAHAYSVLDAYTSGFVLTEVNLPFEPGESADDFVADLGAVLADHPHLAEMVAEQVVGQDYAYGDEFDFGLALVLDGLEQRVPEEIRGRG